MSLERVYTVSFLLLLRLQLLLDLPKHLRLIQVGETILLGGSWYLAWRQVKVDLINFIAQSAPIVSKDDFLSKMFSFFLVPTIVLDLDMQVDRLYTAVNFATIIIGTD